MSRPPVIAISPNALPAEDRALYKGKPLEYGEASLAASVQRAGGLPMMPYRALIDEPDAIAELAEAAMSRCDGLLLSGGQDIAPETYGDALLDPRWGGDPLRDAFEIALYRAAIADGKPVLGVCRGAQLVNVAEGGTLWQDIPSLRPDSLVHRDQERYDTLGHELRVAPGSLLERLLGTTSLWVNSVHHQGVRQLAPRAEAIAWAPDGVVEAFVVPPAGWVLAVQWHPEWMPDEPLQVALFEALVERASR